MHVVCGGFARYVRGVNRIVKASPPDPLSERRGGVLGTVRLGMTKQLFQP